MTITAQYIINSCDYVWLIKKNTNVNECVR